jgi:hypothetical protein
MCKGEDCAVGRVVCVGIPAMLQVQRSVSSINRVPSKHIIFGNRHHKLETCERPGAPRGASAGPCLGDDDVAWGGADEVGQLLAREHLGILLLLALEVPRLCLRRLRFRDGGSDRDAGPAAGTGGAGAWGHAHDNLLPHEGGGGRACHADARRNSRRVCAREFVPRWTSKDEWTGADTSVERNVGWAFSEARMGTGMGTRHLWAPTPRRRFRVLGFRVYLLNPALNPNLTSIGQNPFTGNSDCKIIFNG